MAVKYFKTKYPGVRYRFHPTRKNGVKQDQYFVIYYHLNGKRIDEGLGWASKKWTAEKAAGELARLKEAHRTGRGPHTMAEAREIAEKERQEKAEAKKQAERENITFKEYFKEHYLPSQSFKRADTVRTERGYFKNHIKPVIGNLPFNKITIIHFQKIRANLIKEKNALRTIQYIMAISRQIWNHARAAGYVNLEFPYKNEMKKIKVDNQRLRFLSSYEAKTLLEKIKSKSQQLHDISLLSLHCGLRAGEIFNLKWSNVNIDEGVINILDAKAGSRPAFMTSQVKEMLKSLEQGEPNELIFKDKRHGEKIKEVSNAFNRAIDDLDLNNGITDRRQKLTFHNLRHTFASWLVMQGTPLYTVQKLMGHKTIAMTMRYAHLAPDTLRAAVTTFEKNLRKQKKAKVVNLKA